MPQWLALPVPGAGFEAPLPKKLCFASPGKVVELVERGGGLSNLESRLMVEQGIAMGRAEIG
jgi:hypothetical protein